MIIKNLFYKLLIIVSLITIINSAPIESIVHQTILKKGEIELTVDDIAISVIEKLKDIYSELSFGEKEIMALKRKLENEYKEFTYRIKRKKNDEQFALLVTSDKSEDSNLELFSLDISIDIIKDELTKEKIMSVEYAKEQTRLKKHKSFNISFNIDKYIIEQELRDINWIIITNNAIKRNIEEVQKIVIELANKRASDAPIFLNQLRMFIKHLEANLESFLKHQLIINDESFQNTADTEELLIEVNKFITSIEVKIVEIKGIIKESKLIVEHYDKVISSYDEDKGNNLVLPTPPSQHYKQQGAVPKRFKPKAKLEEKEDLKKQSEETINDLEKIVLSSNNLRGALKSLEDSIY